MAVVPKILKAVKKALDSIPSSDEFLASQAVTCKTEHVFRDYLYFYFDKNPNFYAKKEEPITIPRAKKSPSCDLVIYDRKKKTRAALLELKQFYTDDVIYSPKKRAVIFDDLKKDRTKYKSAKSLPPIINILFLIHMCCPHETFLKHGDEFKYPHLFLKNRKKFSSKDIKNDALIELKKKSSFPKPIAPPHKTDLGCFHKIEVSLYSVFFRIKA